MPTRAAKPCAQPGCPELVRGASRCTGHRRDNYRQDARRRGTANERGYDRNHRKWRRRVLRRDPLCVHCLDEGRVTASKVADHIIPIGQGGARFDMENGQGLCAPCHNRKTAGER